MELTIDVVALAGVAISLGFSVWQAGTAAVTERRQAEQAQTLARVQADLDLERGRAQARLTDDNAEAQARREYRFEALKRLYADVQPLLFQMRDPLQSAVDHIQNFSRAAREDRLSRPEHAWLASAYYMDATLYRLTAPAAYYELLRERLSLVDLSLDARALAAYALLDQYVRAMRADYRLASAFYGEQGYQPDEPTPTDDGRGRRQGVLAGTRDIMVQSMLIANESGRPPRRMVRFGEFQNARAARPAEFEPFAAILTGFRPPLAPVLCTLLLLLAGLAELARRALSRDAPDIMADVLMLVTDDAFWRVYDFGLPPAPAMKLRRVAMSDLLECADRAAHVAA